MGWVQRAKLAIKTIGLKVGRLYMALVAHDLYRHTKSAEILSALQECAERAERSWEAGLRARLDVMREMGLSDQQVQAVLLSEVRRKPDFLLLIMQASARLGANGTRLHRGSTSHGLEPSQDRITPSRDNPAYRSG